MFMGRFLRDESGATAIEYALIASLIAIALVAILAIVLFIHHYYRSLPAAVKQAQLIDQKQQWFEGPNKKRRAQKARAKKR